MGVMPHAYSKLMMGWVFLAYHLRTQRRSKEVHPGELWDQNN